MSEEFNGTEEMVECRYKGSITYIPLKIFLRATYELQFDGKKYVRYKEGAKMYSMSPNSFMKVAAMADAVYHFNKIALVNVEEIDEYMKYLK